MPISPSNKTEKKKKKSKWIQTNAITIISLHFDAIRIYQASSLDCFCFVIWCCYYCRWRRQRRRFNCWYRVAIKTTELRKKGKWSWRAKSDSECMCERQKWFNCRVSFQKKKKIPKQHTFAHYNSVMCTFHSIQSAIFIFFFFIHSHLI